MRRVCERDEHAVRDLVSTQSPGVRTAVQSTESALQEDFAGVQSLFHLFPGVVDSNQWTASTVRATGKASPAPRTEAVTW
jgi:hypothetical protein